MEATLVKYRQKKSEGYTPTLEGYVKKSKIGD
jgi:hypothetical protein